jgi:spore germination protein KA
MLKGFKSLKKIQSPRKPAIPKGSTLKDENNQDRNLTINLSSLKNTFGKTDDVKYREFETFYQRPIKVFICFLDGIVNENYINVNIMKPLYEPNFTNDHPSVESLLQVIKNRIIPTLNIQELTDMEKVVESVLKGHYMEFKPY